MKAFHRRAFVQMNMKNYQKAWNDIMYVLRDSPTDGEILEEVQNIRNKWKADLGEEFKKLKPNLDKEFEESKKFKKSDKTPNINKNDNPNDTNSSQQSSSEQISSSQITLPPQISSPPSDLENPTEKKSGFFNSLLNNANDALTPDKKDSEDEKEIEEDKKPIKELKIDEIPKTAIGFQKAFNHLKKDYNLYFSYLKLTGFIDLPKLFKKKRMSYLTLYKIIEALKKYGLDNEENMKFCTNELYSISKTKDFNFLKKKLKSNHKKGNNRLIILIIIYLYYFTLIFFIYLYYFRFESYF